MSAWLPIVPNEVFDSAESGKSSELGRFELCQDQQFGFYFNSEYQSVDYVSDRYQNEQAHSPIFVRHLQVVAQEIATRFGLSSSVVEVGCGKGAFFRVLSSLGFKSLRGFDKTYEGDDPRITQGYLTPSDGPLNADVLVLRHVLEHVQRPIEFLRDLTKINGKSCSFVIEVPSTDWIIKNSTFWDFTYEHVNYFTSESFQRIFGVCDITETFDSQYLLVIGKSESLVRRLIDESSESSLFSEILVKARRNSIFDYSLKHLGRYWIWGGATKGVLITYHLVMLDSNSARYPEGIVDINPAKQNKFCAGSGIQIFSPESFLSLMRDGDKVFVVNPMYEVEVTKFIEASSSKKVTIEVMN